MTDVAEKPKRKSVAFSDGATVVDADGQVTESPTAETPEQKDDPAVDEVTVRLQRATLPEARADLLQDMFKDLAKKKKKKPAKKETEDGEAEKPTGDDGELDLSGLKKKKKKKAKPADDVDEFEAKLKEVGAEGDNEEEEKPEKAEQSTESVEEGDMMKGTGIWAHDSTQPISYNLLLHRFFTLLHERHPDLAGGTVRSYKIPPPSCLREGNKKTIFANLPEIAKRLKRSDDHIIQFMFAEMGTSGSIDANRRLVIKGRFQSKQIEKYVILPSRS